MNELLQKNPYMCLFQSLLNCQGLQSNSYRSYKAAHQYNHKIWNFLHAFYAIIRFLFVMFIIILISIVPKARILPWISMTKSLKTIWSALINSFTWNCYLCLQDNLLYWALIPSRNLSANLFCSRHCKHQQFW